jgi:hypothetical protein
MEQAGAKPHRRGHFVTYGRSADGNDCFRPVRPNRVAVLRRRGAKLFLPSCSCFCAREEQFWTPPQSGTRQSAISWRLCEEQRCVVGMLFYDFEFRPFMMSSSAWNPPVLSATKFPRIRSCLGCQLAVFRRRLLLAPRWKPLSLINRFQEATK